jgi:hypothetical protein
MAVHGNLDGTRRSEFTVGPEETHGLRKVGSEVALFDPVSGQATLAELLAGGAGLPYYLLDRAGGFVYVGNGEFLTATHYDT